MLLTSEQQKSYENAKICYICQEKFKDKHAKDKKYCKFVNLGTTVIIQVNMEVLRIAYVIESTVYLKKLVWLFTMDLIMINILS